MACRSRFPTADVQVRGFLRQHQPQTVSSCRSAGTYPSEAKAEKTWLKAESDMAASCLGDPKRGRQKFSAYAAET
ncbi:hypothetical protein GCM10009839_27850 [Catenulispora yoronensis]|uniref:Uncharacterized protein n=1 Tax=Catenulispora yoronensis TaxID=450799 RepID=A0ABP5FIR2_9ACTN